MIFCLGLVANADTQVIVQPVSATTNATQTINVQKTTTQPQNISPTVPQSIPFEKCTKKYMIPVEKLYFLALASVNANKFSIVEIQSKSGYILFNVANRDYLLSTVRVDDKSSIVKIVPADNNYFFPLGVLTNFYKYLDLNINTAIEEFG